MKIKEEWKDIKEFEGLYQVSDLANVRRILKNKGFRTKNAYKTSGGYLSINLCKNNMSYKIPLNRLVAQTFIPNVLKKHFVIFKNRDITNCKKDNLEWSDSTQKENINKGILKDVKNIKDAKFKKDVYQYTLDYKLVKKYDVYDEMVGFDRRTIRKCCQGGIEKYKGFIWSYEEIIKNKAIKQIEYSKQFNYEGITILFDILASSKDFPTEYLVMRNGTYKPSAYIPKRKLKCTGILKVTDTYKVASFTFNE